MWEKGHTNLVKITWTTKLVPYHSVKSLQLIKDLVSVEILLSTFQIDGLVQEKDNSIANALET